VGLRCLPGSRSYCAASPAPRQGMRLRSPAPPDHDGRRLTRRRCRPRAGIRPSTIISAMPIGGSDACSRRASSGRMRATSTPSRRISLRSSQTEIGASRTTPPRRRRPNTSSPAAAEANGAGRTHPAKPTSSIVVRAASNSMMVPDQSMETSVYSHPMETPMSSKQSHE
jgi:hypothetical protein